MVTVKPNREQLCERNRKCNNQIAKMLVYGKEDGCWWSFNLCIKISSVATIPQIQPFFFFLFFSLWQEKYQFGCLGVYLYYVLR